MADSEEAQDRIEVFACGPNVCPKGGDHEWGDELVELDDCSASVVCKKCGMDRMSVDMWGE